MYSTSMDDRKDPARAQHLMSDILVSELFKGSRTQRSARPIEPSGSLEAPPSTISETRPTRKRTLALDSDEEILRPSKKGKAATQRSVPPSRAASAEPKTKSTKGKGKAAVKSNPLFLDSDEDGDNTSMAQSMSVINEEEENAMVEDDDDDTMTVTTTGPRHTQRRTATQTKQKKRAVAIMDDDSDNGFGDFGRKKRTRR